MSRFASYIICTAPRSGSTMLCRMLTAIGVAGRPDSHFHGSSLQGWLEESDLTPPPGTPERDILQAVFAAALRAGCNETGPFGLRLQAHSLAFFLERLAVLHPDPATHEERIERAFGRTLFIHLSRQDKVAQAVSYLIAQQTGLWHRAADGTELERLGAHRDPVYDAAALHATIRTMQTHDRDWDAFFSHERITPVRISYEALSDNPIATLRQVLRELGLDPASAEGLRPPTRRLSDATNQSWIRRFMATGSAP